MVEYSIIHFGATYDTTTGDLLSVDAKWEGDSDLTKITSELIDDLNPTYGYWEVPDKVLALCQFRLRFIERDNAYWYFQRID